MQFDSLRAFPYPVLRPDVDDYTNGDIQVTVEFIESAAGLDVNASISFHVSVPEIVEAVTKCQAQYVVVFSCRDTYFRYTARSPVPVFDVSFPPGSLRGEVHSFSYVSVADQINDFKCPWIHPEFGPGPFQYEVGSILALDRPQLVYIDREVFKNLVSFFVLKADDNVSGHEWRVQPTEDHIEILVSTNLKESIDKARNNKSHRAILMNSIYFGAVMHALILLKREGDESRETIWGKHILYRCSNEGIDFENLEEHIIAERLMKNPFRLIEAYVFKGGES